MHVFIDTEFTDFDPQSELISIGLVAAAPTSPSLYLEVADFDRSKCNDFVRAQVLPLLQGGAMAKDFQSLALAVWDWLAELGKIEPLRIAIDAEWDWHWLQGLLACAHQLGRPSIMPPGMMPQPLLLLSVIDLRADGSWEAISNRFAEQFGLRAHHALHDATCNKLIYEFAPHREQPKPL